MLRHFMLAEGEKNEFFSFSFSLCLSVVKRRDFFPLCPLSLFCLEIFVFHLIFLHLLSLLTCLYFFPSFSLSLAFPSLLPSILPSSSLPSFPVFCDCFFYLPFFLRTSLRAHHAVSNAVPCASGRSALYTDPPAHRTPPARGPAPDGDGPVSRSV